MLIWGDEKYMLKIIGRLIGIEWKELHYNKEILSFVLMGSIMFFLFGMAHTERGGKLLYTNRLNTKMMCSMEKKGITNEEMDSIIIDFKDTIPINIREFKIQDIKDRLENYIGELKKKDNSSLNKIIDKLEQIKQVKDKEVMAEQLKKMDLQGMLKKVSKEEIAKKSLENMAQWQRSAFLANVYFIFGTLIGMDFIVIKVIQEVKLLNKKEKDVKG